MTPITYADLIERANVVIDEHRLAEYFSGFRAVLKPAITQYLDHANPYERKLAERAFIVSKARRQLDNTPGTYKLAIPPNRVRILSR